MKGKNIKTRYCFMIFSLIIFVFFCAKKANIVNASTINAPTNVKAYNFYANQMGYQIVFEPLASNGNKPLCVSY